MTRRGVWDIQDVRDKLLAGKPWEFYQTIYNWYSNSSGSFAKFFQKFGTFVTFLTLLISSYISLTFP